MKLSKKSEYAVRALMHLIQHQSQDFCQIHDLSKNEQIPVKFLEQILLSLRHGGLVTSKRGMHGGYALAKLPRDISLFEIVTLMDGPICPVPCTIETSPVPCSCPDPEHCSVRLSMLELKRQIDTHLSGVTLDDLAQLGGPPEALEFVI